MMPPDFVGRELRAVVVPPLQMRAPVQVVSVELYTDGLVVRWLEVGGETPDPGLPARLAAFSRRGRRRRAAPPPERGVYFGDAGEVQLDVSDDAGTHYVVDGGHWYGDDRVMRGDIPFVPAVPAQATTLAITGSGVDVRVALTDGGV